MKIGVFDVGGTYIKYGTSDEQGNLVYLGKVLTPKETHKDFIKCIHSLIDTMDDVEGLAFSMPGFIDPYKGYIALGGSLRYHDQCSFIEIMENEFNMSVSIENDAKCAALAQIWKGDIDQFKNVVVLVFGTGIGSAMIQDNKIYRGSHYMANELSCIISRDLKEYGMNATLGNRFSIPFLVKKISSLIDKEITGEEVFELLKEGNEKVSQVYQEYLKELIIEIFNFQCMYDPDVFIIGGGISEQSMFISDIQKYLDAFIKNLPFPFPYVKIKQAKHASQANLIGAVYNYLQKKDQHL